MSFFLFQENVLHLLDGSKTLKRRRHAKVIRFRNFNASQNRIDYIREQLMLYVPWRNEEVELININHEEKFKIFADIIQKNKKNYVFFKENDYFIEDIQQSVYKDLIESKVYFFYKYNFVF